MKHGLDDTAIEKINGVFTNYLKIEQVLIFGSRVKGNYKPGSDIDITLVGNGINLDLLNKVTSKPDDLLLPYLFDVSIFSHIKNRELIEHITRVGQILFTREEEGVHR